MIIGNFTYDKARDAYTGEITTLTFHRSDLRIDPVEKGSDKEPDYRVNAHTQLGRIEFGAAWKRTSEKGQAFLSVLLDDPGMTAPLNAALFSGEGDSFALVWSRAPKKKPKQD